MNGIYELRLKNLAPNLETKKTQKLRTSLRAQEDNSMQKEQGSL